MRITVCELSHREIESDGGWQALGDRMEAQAAEWLLLPEMIFSPWLAAIRAVDPERWHTAVENHDRWIQRLPELPVRVVIGSRPVIDRGRFYNEGFVWERSSGYRGVHRKYYLPDEEGFWEARWYARGPGDFRVVDVEGMKVGFLICTELWFMNRARIYAGEGVHVIVCPRATGADSTAKWIAGGTVAAVVSGAYCLSSNFVGPNIAGFPFGGAGWAIEPEEGRLLGRTSEANPYITLDIDPAWADKAKHTYPRYVRD
ncbi:MAG: carbon-nitrogen hydrolase family protein [Desulfobacterales bacterium]|nr:carbon-nitrogen hydrolase family protein [Desulfobacterales bacterium]